jgi:hypothetical protein
MEMTHKWQFIQTAANDNALRQKIQAISDIYKAMQTRLDGYRQSAGAIFLAVFATSLTFDSVFIRIFFDKSTFDLISANSKFFGIIIGVSGLLVVTCCAVSWAIIRNIGEHFSEMTSIVYKIDEANDVFANDALLQGEALYPRSFKIDRFRRGVRNVSRSRGEVLWGWSDPARKRFLWITGILMGLQFILFGFLFYLTVWR